jgi:hypothetical protein
LVLSTIGFFCVLFAVFLPPLKVPMSLLGLGLKVMVDPAPRERVATVGHRDPARISIKSTRGKWTYTHVSILKISNSQHFIEWLVFLKSVIHGLLSSPYQSHDGFQND